MHYAFNIYRANLSRGQQMDSLPNHRNIAFHRSSPILQFTLLHRTSPKAPQQKTVGTINYIRSEGQSAQRLGALFHCVRQPTTVALNCCTLFNKMH